MSLSFLKSKTGMTAGIACALVAIALGSWVVMKWRPSIDSLRADCKRALQRRQWDKLRDLGTRWANRDPHSGEARIFQATAFEARQQYQRAADCLALVPESAPEQAAALSALMELQFGSLNQARAGAVTAEKLLERNPQSLLARQRLIYFLTMTLQRVRLNQQIRRALETGTEPSEAYTYLFFLDSLYFANGVDQNSEWLNGDPDCELFVVAQAIYIAETLDTSISLDDREAAQSLLKAQSQKIDVLQKLAQKYPHNVELLAYQLKDCLLNGKVERAVELLAQSPTEALEDNRFWRYKGWIHAQSGQLKEAEAAYLQAIKIHPLDWWTRHLMAELLLRQNRLPEVEKLRELVIEANQLRRALQRAPSARRVPDEIMKQLADYARHCGDQQVATILPKRLVQYPKSKPRPASTPGNQ